MIFTERKTEDGYRYETNDIFGTVLIETKDTRLDSDILDGIVMLLLRSNISAGTVTGEVDTGTGTVHYEFVKKSQWEDDDEDIEICDNTPISTQEQVNEYTPTKRYSGSIFGLYAKFAEAFRGVLKK